jgi:hypothetical protein
MIGRRNHYDMKRFSAYNEHTGWKVTKLSLDTDNRMLRIGVGKHEGKWFFRVDLWTTGWRITK